MEYRAVGNRCAVDFSSLNLPIGREEILRILIQKNFSLVEVDLIALARGCIGTSKYRRGASPSEAPSVFDCSSFIKWLYSRRGIWLPRRSIQQRELGEIVDLSGVVAGDVIFVSGFIDYFYDDPSDGVGHVGIATGNNSVIHAANSRENIAETPFDDFIGGDKFRGIRRYIKKGVDVFTLETPPERGVEVMEDIRWIVLQSLPKTKYV